MKKYIYTIILIAISGLFFVLSNFKKTPAPDISHDQLDSVNQDVDTEKNKNSEELFPMSIEALRQREYLGDNFTIEQTLDNGTNYRQFIASYKSEGLKIYGLLTVPLAPKPENGYPTIIFVHGYIPPKQYSTTGSYPSYQAILARSGFITFKPDLRGHGKSEGEAVNTHFSEKYVVDTMHAIAYLKNYPDVNPQKIGYWGHSNGGEIGLRVVLISSDIKAASFWAGVVGSYPDMLEKYIDKISFLQNASETDLVRKNEFPSENPEFWSQLDPYTYLKEINTTIQLQHATGDQSVPIELSRRLKEELEKNGKTIEYFEYQGDDHNIGGNSSLAWQRSIIFFQENL